MTSPANARAQTDAGRMLLDALAAMDALDPTLLSVDWEHEVVAIEAEAVAAERARLAAAVEGPWTALTAEARAFEAWYEPTRMSVNAWVGVDTTSGLYGGWSVEGDPLYDDWDESEMMTAEGDTPEAVIADLIRIARGYRERIDARRSEDEAEDAALLSPDKRPGGPEDLPPHVHRDGPVHDIWINRAKFRIEGAVYTGAELRYIPTPAIREDYDLYKIESGANDRKIELTDSVQIADGLRLYTAPKIINPGGPT